MATASEVDQQVSVGTKDGSRIGREDVVYFLDNTMGSAASRRKKNTAAKLSAITAVTTYTSKPPGNEESNQGNDIATLQQQPVLQQKESENGNKAENGNGSVTANGTNGHGNSATMQQDAVLQTDSPADRHQQNGANKNGETIATTHDGYITEQPKRTYSTTELKQLILAAVIIQRWFRGYRTRKDLDTEQRMARVIQRKFRRHCLTVEKAVLHQRPARNTASPVPSPRTGQRSPRTAKLADPVGERSPLLIRKFGQAKPNDTGTTSSQDGNGEKGQGSAEDSTNNTMGQRSAEDSTNNTKGQGSVESTTSNTTGQGSSDAADSMTAGQQKGGMVKGQSSLSPSKSGKVSDVLSLVLNAFQ
ncbi:Hypp4815 [Branchiostoma lanceolatum]|uniref:Hypp4815 protein n=1 Tax=Branchiostoma lanceolatum TaxID=7740 RepID=A0A8K0ACD0_BRALA|nr:Hypp4815 [Branchiostoma lanceolatum]